MPRLKDRIIIDTNLWLSFLISKDYPKLDKILANKIVTLILRRCWYFPLANSSIIRHIDPGVHFVNAQ